MSAFNTYFDSHDYSIKKTAMVFAAGSWMSTRTYTFHNFYHPFVGDFIAKLNRDSLSGMLDATWQTSLQWDSLGLDRDSHNKDFESLWQESTKPGNTQQNYFKGRYSPTETFLLDVAYSPLQVDVSSNGPYSIYNWEFLFHIPLTIAVHLSKTQRFAEAQRFFHFIFDPTCTDTSVEVPRRFWKFLPFRSGQHQRSIDETLRLLSTPPGELSQAEREEQAEAHANYQGILDHPFQPHRVARTRHLAYQYHVVMKYLDNLIAWGDHLFQQDTVEAINEATQIYVLASNILGERPQRTPQRGKVRGYTFAELRNRVGEIGNALVELESSFPFNLASLNAGRRGANAEGGKSALFGMGRALYFCIPQNDKLLSYWDTVADRLFKIRHCMNIAGIVRPLALFDPPLDPGMLVKAAAAGIDIGSIVNGLNQPPSPVRSLILIQKALELCGEVRNLGNALLVAFEKGDGEHLAHLRQTHEGNLHKIAQEVRFLQLKTAQEAAKSLLNNRSEVFARYRYHQGLLGAKPNDKFPEELPVNFQVLTESNFDTIFATLVGQYDPEVKPKDLLILQPVGDNSPSQQSGASGAGSLNQIASEDAELNDHLPRARDSKLTSSSLNGLASGAVAVPDADANLHFWGMGGTGKFKVGSALVALSKIPGEVAGIVANWEESQGGMAGKTASYLRRTAEWTFSVNQDEFALKQIGRQIIAALIAEQVANHEYATVKAQVAQSQEVEVALLTKFSNEDLYIWMQKELFRLYNEYYRFAFDTARKAERTLKQELMRPELDAQEFIKFNYWDAGWKGLLSGEALLLDIKRMEVAYHENNKRELELTRHVSLRQLDPLALLNLKATGSCTFTVPEWLYDRDCPGHYMRRIKSVALSIPSVVGSYTSVNCSLSLLKSTLRKSAISGDEYTRKQGEDDDRFVDYIGAVQSIVTSSAVNDSGLFETNLRDDRFLPFEGSGAESTWKLDLPPDYRAFDYATISDVILHIRYTARQGVDPTKVKASLDELFQSTGQANLALLFSLRHDFPTEWHAFAKGTGDFTATIRKDYFPYFAQDKPIVITGLDLFGSGNGKPPKHHVVDAPLSAQEALAAANDGMAQKDDPFFTIKVKEDPAGPTQILTRNTNADVFLVVRYAFDG